jgi:hypothetical protein
MNPTAWVGWREGEIMGDHACAYRKPRWEKNCICYVDFHGERFSKSGRGLESLANIVGRREYKTEIQALRRRREGLSRGFGQSSLWNEKEMCSKPLGCLEDLQEIS